MKSAKLTCVAAITLFAALATPLRLAAQDNQDHKHHKHVRYALTVLRTLGGTTSAAVGLNNGGSVAGFSTTPGDSAGRAVLWSKRIVTDLGSLGGNLSTTFANPNARGDVSGYSNLTTPDPNGEDFCFFTDHLECLGFIWQDGVLTALPTLGGNNSLAYQLNDRQQVVGVAENTTPDPTCTPFNFEAKPVIWENGTVEELPTISGDPDGFGYGINDRGQIAGSTGTCNALVPATSLHAVLWPNGPNGGVIDLGNLGGSMWNIAFYINNRGQVVGQAGVPDGINFHAFLWQKGAMTDLGTLPGDVQSWANNINNKGQAVGTSFPVTGSRAFLWQNGVMTDLNTLIPADSPLYLLEAFGINDHGQISGFGQLSNGELRGYLLDPCDEEHGNGDCGEDTAVAASATDVSPAPATRSSTIGTQNNPELRVAANPMLRRFGPRLGPWYRRLGASTPASKLISPTPSSTEQAGTPECIGIDDSKPDFYFHRGYCSVDNHLSEKLTGYCFSNPYCQTRRTSSCPQGKPAIRLGNDFCLGLSEVWIDVARPCSFF